MKKILSFIVIVFSIFSCEIREVENKPDNIQKYDLFPLNIGNEYYYSYRLEVSGYNEPVIDHKLGSKQWKITSSSSFNDTNIYVIEEITHYEMYILAWSGQGPRDTSYNWREADTVNFMLSEDQESGEITFQDFYIWDIIFHFDEISFQRYWDAKTKIISENFNLNTGYHESRNWHFAADSGIVYIDFSIYSTMGRNYFYTCNLDSLNLIP